eukprot:XP_011673962.1 PREDICTED: neuropeptide Y receptor type 2-like [Strongylocentrotus purpuratus]
MENTSQLHFDYFTIEATEIDEKSLETGTETRRGQEVYNIPFHHRAIVASVLIGLTLIGLLGNILVIIAVVVAKKLRTITNILVVNLAFADLVTCLCIPFQVVGPLSQTEGYPLHDFVCATVAGVAVTCICCSSSTLVVIAIVRWYVITKFVRGQRGIHSPKKLATVVAIIWIGSAALTVVPTLLGMGTLGYSQYYSLSTSINRLIPGTSVFTLYSIVLLPANSAVSPIIYGFKHPNFQSFCGLKSLVNLGLSVNKIKSLPRGSFACAEKLESINLSLNDIAVLDPQWFDGSHRLSTLTFYKSNIHEIKILPWNATNLQTLNLAYNNLNSVNRLIEKELFSRIPSLKYLSLQNNQISTIDPFTLIPTSLNVLIIANNPFTCTCQLEWFRELLDKMNTTIYQRMEDTWFMTKLRMAVEHMNDTKLEKVILIFLEDIDDDHLPYLVRLLLSRNKPYLLWVDDDEDGQELFWAQFQKSMRANRKMNNVIPV